METWRDVVHDPLFLIGVPVNVDRLIRWAGDRGWLGHRGAVVGFDEGRALHHLVDETLGPGVLRPFRLFAPQGKPMGTLYGYCGMGDHALKTRARINARPEYLGILALDRMEGKAMPAEWTAGSRLGFDVRVRPVRRLNEDIRNGDRLFRRGVELDAFLLESLRRGVDARARAGVYLDWLAERLDPVAELDRRAARIVRLERVRISRGTAGITGPDVTVRGVLELKEPDRFAALLARGIGRHRGFGYGMLLLRPAGRGEGRVQR